MLDRRPQPLRLAHTALPSKLERELRAAAAIDSSVHVKAYWLRAEPSGYGFPYYRQAYVWIAPVVISPSLCEVIETFVVKIRGVKETGRGGGVSDTAESNQPSTPVRIRRRRSASTARCAMTDRQCAYLRELELVLPRLLRVASQRTLHPVLQRCSAGARGAELYA